MLFSPVRIFDLNTVFDILVHTTGKNGKKKAYINNEKIKVSSLRLTTFKEKGVKCHSCERVGSHFRLQMTDMATTFHLALWSEDGVEMTKDHIVPKSLGGYDHLNNMQTMCEECNRDKRNTVTTEDYERGYYKELEKDITEGI